MTARTTLPYDVQRCTGRMDDAHWCKQRHTCKRFLAFSQWDKEAGIPDYIGIPAGMAVPACENKIGVTHDGRLYEALIGISKRLKGAS